MWKTNYIAYDIVNRTTKYSDYYSPEDAEAFKAYTEHKLRRATRNLDRGELRDIFLRIYANPIVTKEKFKAELD